MVSLYFIIGINDRYLKFNMPDQHLTDKWQPSNHEIDIITYCFSINKLINNYINNCVSINKI